METDRHACLGQPRVAALCPGFTRLWGIVKLTDEQ
jgi:hypothetical protein